MKAMTFQIRSLEMGKWETGTRNDVEDKSKLKVVKKGENSKRKRVIPGK